jgi:MoaA/NifB/PqqE/SkfB family radical SAM enzyme
MKRIDIKMHYFCNNNCVFCVQEDNKKKYSLRGLSLNEIKEKLEKGKFNGSKEVIFTGGEISLRPKILLSAIKHAKKVGYKSIFLLTNGRMYSYLPNVEDVVNSGVTRVTISIHGSSSRKHDSLTRAEGSFKQAVKGIRNFKKKKINVAINCVINKKNICDLRNISKMAWQMEIEQVQFAFIHMSHAILSDEKRIRNLVPKKKEVISSLLEALAIAEKLGVEAKTEGIPACLLKDNVRNIGDSITRLPETSVFEYQNDVVDFKNVLLSEGRTKRKLCQKCKYFNFCAGPWAEYPYIFGWEEFVPVNDGKNI